MVTSYLCSSVTRWRWLFYCLLPLFALGLRGQGEVVNFEANTTNGLAVATVGGRTLLLACNANDNSVAVIDTATNAQVARVPVGLLPVAVAWDPVTSRFFTANRIGDSVTAVAVTVVGGVVQTRIVATEQVEDEPLDVAMGPGGYLYVAIGGRSLLTRLDPNTLAAVDAYLLTDPFAGIDVVANGVLSSLSSGNALRSPRRIVVDGPRVHVIALKGDTGFDLEFGSPTGYKYDLLTWQPTGGPTSHRGSFGSTNEAAVLGRDGRLYVVGGLARNDIRGNAALRVLPQGLVESRLWVLPGTYTAATPTESRDLNLTATGPALHGESAATPAGVALLHSGNRVTKVFIASQGSDRIVELTANSGAPGTWTRATFDIPPPALVGAMNGPRDLEVVATQNGERLYVLNELDCSISVFNPTLPMTAWTELARIALPNRQSAGERLGRRFLYDARLAGKGKVSCASCHTDGRTDSLAWHLGDLAIPNVAGADIPSVIDPETGKTLNYLIDGVTSGALMQGSVAGTHAFPLDKGRMVTQSLQGLVTHPVLQGQDLFPIGALHWRGDRSSFARFNEAFVNLLAAPAIGTGTGAEAKGISDTDMALFQRYIETIVYEPNREQPRHREFSGSMGSDRTGIDGSGAQRGLENFLARRNFQTLWAPFVSPQGADFAGRSCVMCHSLPGGTNGLICLTDAIGGAGQVPLKSAQLRGIAQREGVLEFLPQLTAIDAPFLPFGYFTPFLLPTPRLGQSGLSHAGDTVVQGDRPAGINQFVTVFFNVFYNIPPSGSSAGDIFEAARLNDLIAFIREFDTGSAPIIGLVASFRGGVGDSGKVSAMEQQAMLANGDVVVHLRVGNVMTGHYLDVQASTTSVPQYRNEATGALLTRASLIAAAGAAGDVAVFQAVPVGSGRRIASVTGNGTWATLSGPAPSNVILQAMRPEKRWREIASVTKNWNVGTGPDDFQWTPLFTPPALPPEDPVFPRAQRILQQALEASTNATGFGVRPTTPGVHHHEPPRRFRVSGSDIRPGARLILGMTSDPNAPAPFATSYKPLEMALFPVRDPATGTLIWETAAEMDPLTTLALLNGGPFAPDVVRTMFGAVLEGVANKLDPDTWNRFTVRVVNANGGSSPFLVVQSLTVVDN